MSLKETWATGECKPRLHTMATMSHFGFPTCFLPSPLPCLSVTVEPSKASCWLLTTAGRCLPSSSWLLIATLPDSPHWLHLLRCPPMVDVPLYFPSPQGSDQTVSPAPHPQPLTSQWVLMCILDSWPHLPASHFQADKTHLKPQRWSEGQAYCWPQGKKKTK